MPDCQICHQPTPRNTFNDHEVVCSDCLLAAVRDAATAQRVLTHGELALLMRAADPAPRPLPPAIFTDELATLLASTPPPGALIARWSDGAIRWCVSEEVQ
jgi:hypothetical protein